ncbi:MAG TPA: hypothetical protein VFS43_05925 [Polyangiaceae bacterium]|nr:hypothetical protein [Polyangiaceae bacterium]
MNREHGLVLVETAGSVAWFAMDASWMLSIAPLAVTLAVPTLLLNLLVFRFLRRTWAGWLVAGAMVAWACMNVLWMAYDLKLTAWGLAAGKAFLALGALMLVASVCISRAEALALIATRFRRLRLRPRA